MNKQLLLAVLVIASCALMALSTIVSMSIIWSIHQPEHQLTGKSVQNGDVRIDIAHQLSIIVDDGLINFSGCSPGRIIYSDTHFGNEYLSCPQFVPDSISVRNDGDVQVNVSLNVSAWGLAHGGTFLESTDNTSFIVYKITNQSTNPLLGGGCVQGLQDSWMNITSGEYYPACDRLRAHAINNSISFDIGIHVPFNVTSGTSEITITFMASHPS
jgi:hypothetical protein